MKHLSALLFTLLTLNACRDNDGKPTPIDVVPEASEPQIIVTPNPLNPADGLTIPPRRVTLLGCNRDPNLPNGFLEFTATIELMSDGSRNYNVNVSGKNEAFTAKESTENSLKYSLSEIEPNQFYSSEVLHGILEQTKIDHDLDQSANWVLRLVTGLESEFYLFLGVKDDQSFIQKGMISCELLEGSL